MAGRPHARPACPAAAHQAPAAARGRNPAASGVSKPFDSWESVRDFALALPGTEMSSSYGRPAVKVRGKAFVYPGREAGSFAVATPLDEKEMLMLTDPDTFWETPHYSGWPAVLVRFGSPDRERIEHVIQRAWWDRLTKAQQKDFGPRL
jgi:hypothetical protein